MGRSGLCSKEYSGLLLELSSGPWMQCRSWLGLAPQMACSALEGWRLRVLNTGRVPPESSKVTRQLNVFFDATILGYGVIKADMGRSVLGGVG